MTLIILSSIAGAAGAVGLLRWGPKRLRDAVLGTQRAGGHGDAE